MSKGVSPLIATVLLIAFTLAAAGIISGWLSSTIKSSTENVGSGIGSQISCSKASLDIIDTVCNDNGNITIVVSNLGPIEVDAPAIYVRSSGGKVCMNTTANTSSTLGPGHSMVLKFATDETQGCQSWGSDSLSYVRLTSVCQQTTAIYAERTLTNPDSCSS